jgi:hypothetical protein
LFLINSNDHEKNIFDNPKTVMKTWRESCRESMLEILSALDTCLRPCETDETKLYVHYPSILEGAPVSYVNRSATASIVLRHELMEPTRQALKDLQILIGDLVDLIVAQYLYRDKIVPPGSTVMIY